MEEEWLIIHSLYNNSSNFVNTGTYSSGLIDRIEILTSGSSAVYGSDAVTGVVNIITTTKEYNEIDFYVGETELWRRQYN